MINTDDHLRELNHKSIDMFNTMYHKLDSEDRDSVNDEVFGTGQMYL